MRVRMARLYAIGSQVATIGRMACLPIHGQSFSVLVTFRSFAQVSLTPPPHFKATPPHSPLLLRAAVASSTASANGRTRAPKHSTTLPWLRNAMSWQLCSLRWR